MSTHCNFTVIEPQADGKYRVLLVRGVEASGNSGAVSFETLADDLALADADGVARSARHISKLNYWEYAPARKP